MSSFCIKVFKLILFLQTLLCWKWGKKNGRRQKVRTALPLDDIILAMYLYTMRHTLLLRRRNAPLSLQIPVENHSLTNM